MITVLHIVVVMRNVSTVAVQALQTSTASVTWAGQVQTVQLIVAATTIVCAHRE